MTPPPYLKIFQLIVVVILFVSCDKKIKPEAKSQAKETIVKVADTAKITITVNDERLEFTKSELKKHEEYFNELGDMGFPAEPDIAYARSKGFGSEAGQDNFCLLYAYFLQQKNGVERHDALRKRLLNIFLAINKLNSRLQYGGTYFGHQISRINAYAEYEVYRSIDDDWYIKKYSIDKQKKMFLESLRQHILDEEEYDYYTLGKEKIERRKELLKIIDEIGSQIETFYDLRKAQEFQYSYYNWL